ncbi:MAG: DUF2232 domain-containing protein [Clostridia bacterium]|nr:DUF2232 domain-containing protein [Clostridia bacterium]MBQ2949154.1 DUF2232 domain-containing protein [Clostridia bacterium]MBQ6858085.1 DUF2232 domain-containing protein [Clostridia bacterium]MBQ7052265.1 DUF2232 domain-containing protein [Clostridia bacterium]
MEKQRVSIFRQKNKKGLTVLSIVLCLVLSPALSAMMFLPNTLTMMPVVLLLLLGYVGPVSALGCTAALIAASGFAFGVWGLLCMALLLVPVVLVSAFAVEREEPFWQSVAAGGVTMFAALFGAVSILSLLAGSDFVSAITHAVNQAFEMSGALGDTMLSMMVQMGVMSAPEGVDVGAMTALDPQTREQMLTSIVMMMDSVLRLEIPMRMATGAVAAGLLGQAALRKGLRSHGNKVEYPRLRTWRIPSGWGRILGGTLVILYLLAMLVPSSMNTMFYVFSGVFDQLFAIQGIAALCYLIYKKDKPALWQRVVFVAGYFFFGSFAMLIGIADQAVDFTHRREELDKIENPFDPRRSE